MHPPHAEQSGPLQHLIKLQLCPRQAAARRTPSQMLTCYLLPQVCCCLLCVSPCPVDLVSPVLLSGRVQPNAVDGGWRHARNLLCIQGRYRAEGTTGPQLPQGWAMIKPVCWQARVTIPHRFQAMGQVCLQTVAYLPGLACRHTAHAVTMLPGDRTPPKSCWWEHVVLTSRAGHESAYP